MTDFVEAMNTLIQERHNHCESRIILKSSRRTRKVEISFASDISDLSFFSRDLGYISGSDVGKEFGVMLKDKGPHKPEFVNDTVRLQPLMIYTNLIRVHYPWRHKNPIAALLFIHFKVQICRYYDYWTVKKTLRHLATCNSDHCSKIFVIVISLTWEIRAVKKSLCGCRNHSFFWFLEKNQHSNLILKKLQNDCFKTRGDSIL